MATAFDDATNEQLRRMAREIMAAKCDGKQNRLAEAIGVSPSYVSDFLNDNRGAGMEMLAGLGRLDPLRLLEILKIDPRWIVNLVNEGEPEDEAGLDVLPDVVRRAMRATIEVTGCAPAEAFEKALEAHEQHGDVHLDDTEWWYLKVRGKIPERPKSGERPSIRLKKADRSQA